MTFNEFLNLSAALTGYPAGTLKPFNDTELIADQLYAELSKQENNIPTEQLNLLTSTWNAISNTPPAQLEAKVKTEIIANIAIARLAQNIIYMWYLGIWYDLLKNPNSFIFPDNVDKNHVNQDHVVSSSVYTKGLVWGEMGAHPMGYSTGTFGYWENEPTLPTIELAN
jgi:hypothetical protein